MTVAGAAALARAAFKPRRLRSFFDLAAELLDPQRVAIAMALLDNRLRIGEHSVAVGPVCEISSSGDSSSSSVSRSSSNGLAAAGVAAAALLAALLAVVSQKFIDAAVGAAADVAEGSKSRASLLHAADTVLALATLQQDMQLRQQQQQSSSATVPGSVSEGPAEGSAPAQPQQQLQQAAAVMHCALGDPHSCVTAEELAAVAAAGRSSGSNGNTMQLLTTLFGLHVTLFKDLGSLWWAYHSRMALNLAGRA
jgi:hypothetical protein